MALDKLTTDLDIIQKLDDEPNDVGGLTAQELKEKFDEAGNTIQKYLNETLIPQLEKLGVEQSVLLPENDAGFKYLRMNADKVLEVLEMTTPELVADISKNGIVLTGGASQLYGMDRLIEERTEIHCMLADDADSCVAYGCGKSLAWINHMQEGPINIAKLRIMRE